VKVNLRSLSGTMERKSVAQHLGRKRTIPDLVKEVVPGDNIEDICSFPDVWSMEPFVNSVAGDQKFE